MENNIGQVVLVKDINPDVNRFGGVGSNIVDIKEYNGKLYFNVLDGENVRQRQLWISDGTTEGTQLLQNINPDIGSFRAYLSLLSSITEYPEYNGKFFFGASDGENGRELWISDGTIEGTQLLVDINSNMGDERFTNSSSSPSGFTEYNDKLHFSADDGKHGRELWVTDGTTEGTQLLADINPNLSSDGDAYGSNSGGFAEYNGKLYFIADDGEHGRELWVTDGTTKGTQLLLDINPGFNANYNFAESSNISNLMEYNGKLYFTADDGEHGRELWVSDGTTEGTQLLLNINPGIHELGGIGTGFTHLIEYNGKLYFGANDGENGDELWVSDGTAEGTRLVADINPNFPFFLRGYSTGYSRPSDFTEFNGKLYFKANDGENGRELWVTDGTTEGTRLVADINPGRDSGFSALISPFPRTITVVGDELFFSADNGETGNELFKLTFDDLITDITGTAGSDHLVGGDGADRIEGLNGNDSLTGGDNNDSLIGGAGKDVLTGGDGNDIFVLESGNGENIIEDIITDFELGKDRLGLVGDLKYEDLTFSGSTINAGDELLATLTGVDTEQLTSQDFTVI